LSITAPAAQSTAENKASTDASQAKEYTTLAAPVQKTKSSQDISALASEPGTTVGSADEPTATSIASSAMTSVQEIVLNATSTELTISSKSITFLTE
jgi:hypothetical protein